MKKISPSETFFVHKKRCKFSLFFLIFAINYLLPSIGTQLAQFTQSEESRSCQPSSCFALLHYSYNNTNTIVMQQIIGPLVSPMDYCEISRSIELNIRKMSEMSNCVEIAPNYLRSKAFRLLV